MSFLVNMLPMPQLFCPFSRISKFWQALLPFKGNLQLCFTLARSIGTIPCVQYVISLSGFIYYHTHPRLFLFQAVPWNPWPNVLGFIRLSYFKLVNVIILVSSLPRKIWWASEARTTETKGGTLPTNRLYKSFFHVESIMYVFQNTSRLW